MNIFKDPFERFKSRIKKNQKQKSAWKVTRWAIHDTTKFENLINRLEKYVNGLSSIGCSGQPYPQWVALGSPILSSMFD